MNNILHNQFEHVVLINPEYREERQVTIWLFDNIHPMYYEQLYAQRMITGIDGINETQSVFWGAAFKYAVDATAFKLRWS